MNIVQLNTISLDGDKIFIKKGGGSGGDAEFENLDVTGLDEDTIKMNDAFSV